MERSERPGKPTPSQEAAVRRGGIRGTGPGAEAQPAVAPGAVSKGRLPELPITRLGDSSFLPNPPKV